MSTTVVLFGKYFLRCGY